MHLTIDIGNTATKMAMFAEAEANLTEASQPVKPALQVRQPQAHLRLDGHQVSHVRHFVRSTAISASIVSSTVPLTARMKECVERVCPNRTIFLDHTTPIPLRNLYATPQTLGTDRLAAVVGAYFEGAQLTGSHVPILVIDAGTAITYDFVTAEGEYLGGNISPGIEMRFQALHRFTAKLPLVAPDGQHPQMGNTTETAIRCGVTDGVKHEIQGYVRQFFLKYPNLFIFLTGGDSLDFEERVKKRIFADKFLVSKGLDLILQYQDK